MAKSKRDKVKSYVIYGGIGLSLCTEIAVAGILGWLLGDWVDKKIGIRPWGTTLGILLFVAISFVHIVRVLQQVTDRLDKEEES